MPSIAAIITPMKIFQQADSPANDTVEFKLLNLTWCQLFRSEQVLDVDYVRDELRLEAPLTFEKLRGVHKKLPEMLDYIFGLKTDHKYMIRALVAYLSDCYIDFSAIDSRNSKYLLAHVNGISYKPDQDEFVLKALFFAKAESISLGIDVAFPLRYVDYVLTSSSLDQLWPNASMHVKNMEQLGYTSNAIFDYIACSLPAPEVQVDTEDLTFQNNF